MKGPIICQKWIKKTVKNGLKCKNIIEKIHTKIVQDTILNIQLTKGLNSICKVLKSNLMVQKMVQKTVQKMHKQLFLVHTIFQTRYIWKSNFKRALTQSATLQNLI